MAEHNFIVIPLQGSKSESVKRHAKRVLTTRTVMTWHLPWSLCSLTRSRRIFCIFFENRARVYLRSWVAHRLSHHRREYGSRYLRTSIFTPDVNVDGNLIEFRFWLIQLLSPSVFSSSPRWSSSICCSQLHLLFLFIPLRLLSLQYLVLSLRNICLVLRTSLVHSRPICLVVSALLLPRPDRLSSSADILTTPFSLEVSCDSRFSRGRQIIATKRLHHWPRRGLPSSLAISHRHDMWVRQTQCDSPSTRPFLSSFSFCACVQVIVFRTSFELFDCPPCSAAYFWLSLRLFPWLSFRVQLFLHSVFFSLSDQYEAPQDSCLSQPCPLYRDQDTLMCPPAISACGKETDIVFLNVREKDESSQIKSIASAPSRAPWQQSEHSVTDTENHVSWFSSLSFLIFLMSSSCRLFLSRISKRSSRICNDACMTIHLRHYNWLFPFESSTIFLPSSIFSPTPFLLIFASKPYSSSMTYVLSTLHSLSSFL